MWHVWKTQKPMKPEPGHLLWHQNRAEGGGGNSSHWATTRFCGTLRMTTHKPELNFCSWVQNWIQEEEEEEEKKAKSKQSSDWNSFEFFLPSPVILCYFFLYSHENEKKPKNPDIWYQSRARFGLCFPPFIYGTETEPHKWAGGSCSIACAARRRRGKINARQTLRT